MFHFFIVSILGYVPFYCRRIHIRRETPPVSPCEMGTHCNTQWEHTATHWEHTATHWEHTATHWEHTATHSLVLNVDG